jgi:hypothetical protein
MSTLKLDNIQHPDAVSAALTFDSDGTMATATGFSSGGLKVKSSGGGTFSINPPSSASDRTLTLPDEAGTVLTSAGTDNFPSGTVLQIQYTMFTETNTYSFSNGVPLVLTDLTVGITPRSAASVFKIEASIMCEFGVEGADWNHVFFFYRDTTKLANTTAGASQSSGIAVAGRTYFDTDAGSTPNGVSYMYFDAPNTTNTITYKVGFQASETSGLYLNRTVADSNSSGYERGVSTISVTEIAG